MKQWDFFYEFKRLCEYYKDKTYEDKRITKLYYEKVKNMDINQFKSFCDELINKYTFMPRVAEFEISSGIGHRGRKYTEEFLNQFYDN